ncbi:unnamed protein product [Trichogramma brassicae]|uniref:Uncharacterized protein n=1 Tax=Trichogramma brassicae TaxID=86971 RepID=A0A6H5J4W4_9HYME|nr:unnamed protein product [Trichogramma brassicae]
MYSHISDFENLKSLRDSGVNWESGKERIAFFSKLNTVIFNWKDPLPDVREIFSPKEIDQLIIESMKCVQKPGFIRWPFNTLVKFLIKTGYEDEPELDEDDGEVILQRTTPLHFAASDVLLFGFGIDHLFRIYPRVDANYANESGLTHLHVACMFKSCERFAREFIDHGQDPNLLWQGKGQTPLHLVAQRAQSWELIEFMLKRGANPRMSNANGETVLHALCKRGRDDLVEALLNANGEPCDIDAVENSGRTPLLVALNHRDKKTALLLLKKGATPDAVDETGSTALHLMCRRNFDSKSIEQILDAVGAGDDVPINARDSRGRTALHYALYLGDEDVIELLLRRGADPNTPDNEGTTAMHCISRRRLPAGDLAKTLLKVCGEIDRVVQIDFRDTRRRTPLEWAVANLQPQLVEILLKLDDDLSGFKFPTYTHFDQCFEWHAKRRVGLHRLKLAAGVLACLERLEKHGYRLKPNDAKTIATLFNRNALVHRLSVNAAMLHFDSSVGFATWAKVTMVRPNLTLHELMHLRPEEVAKKRVTNFTYFNLAESEKLWRLPTGPLFEACDRHLCEEVVKRFYRRVREDFPELEDLVKDALTPRTIKPFWE